MVGMLTIFSLIAASLQESGFISALNRKEETTQADYNAVFWFNILCSSGIYILLFLCAPLIAEWFHEPKLTALARFSFLSFRAQQAFYWHGKDLPTGALQYKISHSVPW